MDPDFFISTDSDPKQFTVSRDFLLVSLEKKKTLAGHSINRLKPWSSFRAKMGYLRVERVLIVENAEAQPSLRLFQLNRDQLVCPHGQSCHPIGSVYTRYRWA